MSVVTHSRGSTFGDTIGRGREGTRCVKISHAAVPCGGSRQPRRNMLNDNTQVVRYKRSKSSSLSRYFRMFRLIFDESTQVTKSSRFL